MNKLGRSQKNQILQDKYKVLKENFSFDKAEMKVRG